MCLTNVSRYGPMMAHENIKEFCLSLLMISKQVKTHIDEHQVEDNKYNLYNY